MSGPLSSVAAVLDGYGGWHVVVSEEWQLPCHVRPGQLLVIVPNYKVREPVAWDHVPALIRRAEKNVLRWIEGINDPELRNHDAIKLFLLRRQRTHQMKSVDLEAICYT